MSRLGCSAGCFRGCGGRVQTFSLQPQTPTPTARRAKGGSGPARGHQCHVPILSERFGLVWGWFPPGTPPALGLYSSVALVTTETPHSLSLSTVH